MCERPGYWWWLYQLLLEKIRSPVFEIIIGVVAGLFFFVLSFCSYDDSPLYSFDMRVVLLLLSILSFLVFMHGIYRADDC